MNNLIKKILVEWSYRLDDGIINLHNPKHMLILSEVLKDMKLPTKAILEVMGNLTEKKKPGDVWKTKTGWAGLKAGEDKAQYGMDSKETAKKYVKGGKTTSTGDVFKTDTPTETEQSTSGVSTKSINSIDGDEKTKTMNGEESPPGTETSAVAEIGTGDAMACLSENNNNMEKADKCLEEKLSKTKLGKAHGTGESKKEFRRGILQAAKRENQRVKEINEQLGWKNSQTAHIGGSKSSLKKTVDKLREKGITHINGIPIDEYEKIILGGGGGDNPTDTMVCIINEETGEVIMYHTSNKMTSKDIIANGSPRKEIKEVIDVADYNEEERRQAEEAGEETRKNIAKHREDQKKYIQEQQDKMIEDSEDPEIARKAIDRLKGVKDGVTTASDKEKYWKKILAHKSVKEFMKEKGYNKNNLTPEQEVEIYQFYVREMKRISSMDNPPEDRRSGGVGEVDIQIMTRLYGEGQEEITTGNEPREPIFSDKEMKSYYDKQTEEINSLREKMNKIKEGSGDKAFAKRMEKRLHLDIADGHNPGGIPNNRIETNMGVYAYKDLRQDSEGNLYQQKNGKGPYYKLDENGNLTDEVVDKKDLQDFDCAVVGDKETMKACLGVGEGEEAGDDIRITMGEYEGDKAIIYDRNRNKIGVQVARSKVGPGGEMQDTILYHRDFQLCLAKQTKIQGKCG